MLYIKSLPKYTFDWVHVWVVMVIVSWISPFFASALYGTSGVLQLLPMSIAVFVVVSALLGYIGKRSKNPEHISHLFTVCLEAAGAHVMLAMAFLNPFPVPELNPSLFILFLSFGLFLTSLGNLGRDVTIKK